MCRRNVDLIRTAYTNLNEPAACRKVKSEHFPLRYNDVISDYNARIRICNIWFLCPSRQTEIPVRKQKRLHY